jgi:hypothetical protein
VQVVGVHDIIYRHAIRRRKDGCHKKGSGSILFGTPIALAGFEV